MFSKRPIIVLGVNHSGTRVVVDILSALGSDGGDCNNTWRENKFFLSIHRDLIGASDDDDWNRQIFDIDFVSTLAPDISRANAARARIEKELLQAYPRLHSMPWHWKCPTSALFLDFWLAVFPDAWYVHIVRDPLDVAQSLISRRQCYTLRSALSFYSAMESRLAKAAGARNYLRLDYETLPDELDRLVTFVPPLDRHAIDSARALFRTKQGLWTTERSLRNNLWRMSVACRIAVAKALRGPIH